MMCFDRRAKFGNMRVEHVAGISDEDEPMSFRAQLRRGERGDQAWQVLMWTEAADVKEERRGGINAITPERGVRLRVVRAWSEHGLRAFGDDADARLREPKPSDQVAPRGFGDGQDAVGDPHGDVFLDGPGEPSLPGSGRRDPGVRRASVSCIVTTTRGTFQTGKKLYVAGK